MRTWSTSLHDAEVVALESRRASKALVLKLKLPTGASASLEFTEVEGWELSPFREQNVLLDLRVWSSSDTRIHERCQELGLPQAWSDAVMHSDRKLYELDASAGLCGYVIAGSAEYLEPADGAVTNQLARLQAWYTSQCDSSWEHEYGVEIDTLDNPGWSVSIDLEDPSYREWNSPPSPSKGPSATG